MTTRPKTESHTWTTQSELAFLAGLGTHAPHLKRSRAVLLQQYLRDPRSDWGQVSADRCLAYVRDALLKEGHAHGQ